jgi:hypothetical protein
MQNHLNNEKKTKRMHSQRCIMQFLNYFFHTSSLVFTQVLIYPSLISKYDITNILVGNICNLVLVVHSTSLDMINIIYQKKHKKCLIDIDRIKILSPVSHNHNYHATLNI